MNHSDEIKEIAGALVKAQAEMKNPPFDARNPHFNSDYASLASVRDAVMPVFNRHGIAVIQVPGSNENGDITCATLLYHESGQWIMAGNITIKAKQDAHGAGSALTYARRYSLMAVAGVVGDTDDDGNASLSGQKPVQEPRKQPAGTKAPAKEEKPPKGNSERLRILNEIKEGADLLGLTKGQLLLKCGKVVGNVVRSAADLNEDQAKQVLAVIRQQVEEGANHGKD